MTNRNFENRELKTVSFNVLDKGLGVCIIGGEEGLVDDIKIPGIFIKTIVPGGLAALDGRLREGDQIVSVNGESLADVTNEKAVEILRRASEEGFVQMKICRDEKASQDYKDICEMYIFSRTNTPPPLQPLPSQHSPLSPSSPPSQTIPNDQEIANAIERNMRNDLDSKQKPNKDPTYNQDNSIDPFIRLKIERLKQSLRFLGIQPSEEEEEEMRSRLDIDENGTVAYGDFVKLAKEMFAVQGNQKPAKLSDDKVTTDNYLRNNQLAKDNQELRTMLGHKYSTITALEREIIRYKNDHSETQEELRNLKNKLRLLEEAQRMARRTEDDYETVLRLFEHNTIHDQRLANNRQVLNRIEYDLKNVDTSRKLQETAADKLMTFAKFVVESLKRRKQQAERHEMMKIQQSSSSPSSSLSLTYLDFSSSDDMIMMEAVKTINAVNALLQLDDLPEGLETAKSHYKDKGLISPKTNPSSPLYHSPIPGDVIRSTRPGTNLSAPVYSNNINNNNNRMRNNNNNNNNNNNYNYSYYNKRNVNYDRGGNVNNEDFYYRDYIDKRSL